MTVSEGPILRDVGEGKWRLDLPCSCGFLFSRTLDGKAWVKNQVRTCNQTVGGVRHRRKDTEIVTTLPRVEA